MKVTRLADGWVRFDIDNERKANQGCLVVRRKGDDFEFYRERVGQRKLYSDSMMWSPDQKVAREWLLKYRLVPKNKRKSA